MLCGLPHRLYAVCGCRLRDTLSKMAAGPGLEPGQADSKSAVLPLHNPAPSFDSVLIIPYHRQSWDRLPAFVRMNESRR